MKRSPDNIGRLVLRRGPEVAHDISSPLNTILINAGLVRAYLESRGGEALEEINHVSAIERETDRVRQIVEAFFDAVAGPIEVESEFDLVALARGVAQKFGGRFACDSARAPIEGDEPRTRLLLRSMFEGAARNAGGTLDLVTMACDAGKFSLRVHGAGADLQRVSRFANVDGDGHSAIALAVARVMAEALGGSLQIADEKIELVIPLERE